MHNEYCALLAGMRSAAGGNFYAVISHETMERCAQRRVRADVVDELKPNMMLLNRVEDAAARF